MTPSEALRKAASKQTIAEMGQAAFRANTALHLSAYEDFGEEIKEAIFRAIVYENGNTERVRQKILSVAVLMEGAKVQ